VEKNKEKETAIFIKLNSEYIEMFNFLKEENNRNNRNTIEFLIKQEFLKLKTKKGEKNANKY